MMIMRQFARWQCKIFILVGTELSLYASAFALHMTLLFARTSREYHTGYAMGVTHAEQDLAANHYQPPAHTHANYQDVATGSFFQSALISLLTLMSLRLAAYSMYESTRRIQRLLYAFLAMSALLINWLSAFDWSFGRNQSIGHSQGYLNCFGYHCGQTSPMPDYCLQDPVPKYHQVASCFANDHHNQHNHLAELNDDIGTGLVVGGGIAAFACSLAVHQQRHIAIDTVQQYLTSWNYRPLY
jgi:hypothetical protein